MISNFFSSLCSFNISACKYSRLVIPSSFVFLFAYAILVRLRSAAVTLQSEKLDAVPIEVCPVPQPAISITGEDTFLIFSVPRLRFNSSQISDIDFVFKGIPVLTHLG